MVANLVKSCPTVAKLQNLQTWLYSTLNVLTCKIYFIKCSNFHLHKMSWWVNLNTSPRQLKLTLCWSDRQNETCFHFTGMLKCVLGWCLPLDYQKLESPIPDGAVNVDIDVEILDILSINDKEFSITMSMYFSVQWQESRWQTENTNRSCSLLLADFFTTHKNLFLESGQTTPSSPSSGTQCPLSSSMTSGSPMCSSTTSRVSKISLSSRDSQVSPGLHRILHHGCDTLVS